MAYYHLREKSDLKMNNVFKEPIKVSTDTKLFWKAFWQWRGYYIFGISLTCRGVYEIVMVNTWLPSIETFRRKFWTKEA